MLNAGWSTKNDPEHAARQAAEGALDLICDPVRGLILVTREAAGSDRMVAGFLS